LGKVLKKRHSYIFYLPNDALQGLHSRGSRNFLLLNCLSIWFTLVNMEALLVYRLSCTSSRSIYAFHSKALCSRPFTYLSTAKRPINGSNSHAGCCSTSIRLSISITKRMMVVKAMEIPVFMTRFLIWKLTV